MAWQFNPFTGNFDNVGSGGGGSVPVGTMIIQGSWNALTNTPTLTSGTGVAGYAYQVSVPGSTNIDGITQWNVGDWAVFSGSTWSKLDGLPTEVISVAGRTGAVVLSSGDISGLGSLATATPGTGVATAIGNNLNAAGGLVGYSFLGSAAFQNTSAFDAAGAATGLLSSANTWSDAQTFSSYLQVANQTKPATPTGGSRIYFDSSNRFSWVGTNGYARTFDGSGNTADRIYTLPDYAMTVGSQTIPQNSQTANYTTVLGDSGKHILMNGSNLTFTVDSNANVAFATGTVITVVNSNSTSLTIAITSDTLTFAGTTLTGSRTLAQNGIATLIKTGSTSWLITGTGLA